MHQHLAWEAKKDQVIPAEPLCTNVYSLNPSRWRRWRIALTVYAAGWKGRKEWVGKVYKSGTWKLTKKNSALELRQRSSTRPAPLFLFLAFVASTDRCIQERGRENGIYLIHLLWCYQSTQNMPLYNETNVIVVVSPCHPNCGVLYVDLSEWKEY